MGPVERGPTKDLLKILGPAKVQDPLEPFAGPGWKSYHKAGFQKVYKYIFKKH